MLQVLLCPGEWAGCCKSWFFDQAQHSQSAQMFLTVYTPPSLQAKLATIKILNYVTLVI